MRRSSSDTASDDAAGAHRPWSGDVPRDSVSSGASLRARVTTRPSAAEDATDVDPAPAVQTVEPRPLDRQETGAREVALPVLDVDFAVRHVEVAGEQYQPTLGAQLVEACAGAVEEGELLGHSRVGVGIAGVHIGRHHREDPSVDLDVGLAPAPRAVDPVGEVAEPEAGSGDWPARRDGYAGAALRRAFVVGDMPPPAGDLVDQPVHHVVGCPDLLHRDHVRLTRAHPLSHAVGARRAKAVHVDRGDRERRGSTRRRRG